MKQTVTDVIASLAVVAPWFILPHINELLSTLLTLLGIIWLVIQIWYKLKGDE